MRVPVSSKAAKRSLAVRRALQSTRPEVGELDTIHSRGGNQHHATSVENSVDRLHTPGCHDDDVDRRRSCIEVTVDPGSFDPDTPSTAPWRASSIDMACTVSAVSDSSNAIRGLADRAGRCHALIVEKTKPGQLVTLMLEATHRQPETARQLGQGKSQMWPWQNERQHCARTREEKSSASGSGTILSSWRPGSIPAMPHRTKAAAGIRHGSTRIVRHAHGAK
jgi:hypothetical protein